MRERERERERERSRIEQWFSTGVPRNPRVPLKVLGVPRISDLYVYLLVNFNQGAAKLFNSQGRVPQIKKG